MLISRSDRSKKAIWFWTIDRWLFSSFLVLITLGAFFIMASGPKIANNLGLDTHFFTVRHIIFLIIGLIWSESERFAKDSRCKSKNPNFSFWRVTGSPVFAAPLPQISGKVRLWEDRVRNFFF